MEWVSVADLADPNRRAQAQAQHMQACVARAKFEQEERHHAERMSIERDRLQASAVAAKAQADASVERERVAGDNAISLATRTHLLGQMAKSSALIDETYMSVIRQDEEWSRVVGDTLRGLVLAEADTIRQERLRRLDQAHLVEKMRLECNLKMAEMTLAHELQNQRVTYDRTCDIIFRLVERALGLGSQQADPDEIRGWVQEAMAQTGG